MANKQQQNDPLKRKTMQAVRDAVRRGHLAKPDRCTNCNTETPRRTLAAHHHRGYANKYSVLWLCPRCHSMENRNAAGQFMNQWR